jgi:hypothetical protein
VLTSVGGAVVEPGASVATGTSVTVGAAPQALATSIIAMIIKEIFILLNIRVLLEEIRIFGK